MLSFCYPEVKKVHPTVITCEDPWKRSPESKPIPEKSILDNDAVSTISENSNMDYDEASTSLEETVDSPRSEASRHSWGGDSLVEICSICPVPSVAKVGALELKKRSFIIPRSCKRFCAIRDGCLEVWVTKEDYANDSSTEEVMYLQDLKDMDQYEKRLTLRFVNRNPEKDNRTERLLELCADSVSDAGDWFEAIEFVLRSMSMPIKYSLRESPVFQPDILQDFQRLLDHCFFHKSTRDRRGENLPKRLKVVRVVRVQNSTLLREYHNMQCEIDGQLTDADRQKSYDILSPDVRTSLLDPPLQTLPQLEDKTIERWLFHGTKLRGLEGIAESNFDLSRAGSGAGGLYGKGIYCAECTSKADEYTEEDAKGVRGLLLCRATLGKILYCSEWSPNTSWLQEEKTTQRCHTILGDRWTASGTYREYIFGQKEQLYPEFIIYYQREN